MNGVQSTRFMRPDALRPTRRNYRQMQVQRLLVISANLLVVTALVLGGVWLYQRTQSDSRFAVTSVEISGSVQTSAAELETIRSAFHGTNLFRLDIEQVRAAALELPWVERVAVEKRIPDALVIHLFEKQPVALAAVGERFAYVDGNGRRFAPLSPKAGNPELPVIRGAVDDEGVRAAIAFLHQLEAVEPALASRVSEVMPLIPVGFSIFDRDLATTVLLRSAGDAARWKHVYRISETEGFRRGDLAYADLRFDRRIVIRPHQRLPGSGSVMASLAEAAEPVEGFEINEVGVEPDGSQPAIHVQFSRMNGRGPGSDRSLRMDDSNGVTTGRDGEGDQEDAEE